MDIEEVLDHCVANNPPAFNMNKALEEAVEFQEVLLKLQTKHPDNPKRPTRTDALEEYGDLLYRGLIAVRTLFPDLTGEEVEDKINEHIDIKLTKLAKYHEEGKYGSGL